MIKRCCTCSSKWPAFAGAKRSEEHTSELQSQSNIVCRLLLEKNRDRRPSGPAATGSRRQLHYAASAALCRRDSSCRLSQQTLGVHTYEYHTIPRLPLKIVVVQ